MAAGHGLVDFGPLLAGLAHGGGDRRFGLVVAVRKTQAVLQVAAGLQVPAQRVAAEQLDRLPCHFGRYERIPVAVAADPGAEAEEAADAEGAIAVVADQARAEIAKQPRHDFPERARHVQVSRHLVEHARPQRPHRLRFPEAHQLRLQPLQLFFPLPAEQVTAIERLQRLAHPAQQAAERDPLGLRGMGREDGANVQAIQELLDLVGRTAGSAQGVDGRADRLAPLGREGRLVAAPQHPHAIAILGQVDQFQVAAVHPHQLLEMIDVQVGQLPLDLRGGLRVATAPPFGQSQQRLTKIQEFARPMFADHAGQFPAEQPHVAAQ